MGTEQRTLLLRAAVFLLPFFGALALLGVYFAMRDGVPPITNSYSFDAKLEELRDKRIQHTDVLLLGSSLTLNNVSSDVLGAVLDPQSLSFHNVSAWGLKMTDLEPLCRMYVEHYTPRTVLICTSTEDFAGRAQLEAQPRPVMEGYINGVWKGWYFMRFPLVSQIHNWEAMIGSNSVQDSLYTSLKYDEDGGVALHMTPTTISQKRLNLPFHYESKHAGDQYEAFEHMSHWLKKKGVHLVVVRTPVRSTYSSGPYAQEVFAQHARRCAAILAADGHVFIDRMDLPMQDDLFVDVNHLGADGASVFTKSWAWEAFP